MGRIPSWRALALRGQAACGGHQGSRGREAGPAAVLETCLPQKSLIFKNNSGGFCLAFALKDFFSFCTEFCSSGRGQPALAPSGAERAGAAWGGPCPGRPGVRSRSRVTPRAAVWPWEPGPGCGQVGRAERMPSRRSSLGRGPCVPAR